MFWGRADGGGKILRWERMIFVELDMLIIRML